MGARMETWVWGPWKAWGPVRRSLRQRHGTWGPLVPAWMLVHLQSAAPAPPGTLSLTASRPGLLPLPRATKAVT